MPCPVAHLPNLRVDRRLRQGLWAGVGEAVEREFLDETVTGLECEFELEHLLVLPCPISAWNECIFLTSAGNLGRSLASFSDGCVEKVKSGVWP